LKTPFFKNVHLIPGAIDHFRKEPTYPRESKDSWSRRIREIQRVSTWIWTGTFSTATRRNRSWNKPKI